MAKNWRIGTEFCRGVFCNEHCQVVGVGDRKVRVKGRNGWFGFQVWGTGVFLVRETEDVHEECLVHATIVLRS